MPARVAGRLRGATQKVLLHFLSRDAVSASHAVSFHTHEPLERRVLARFLDCGVLIEVERRTYYLDRRAYEHWVRTVRSRAAFAVLALIVITIALLVIGLSAAFGR